MFSARMVAHALIEQTPWRKIRRFTLRRGRAWGRLAVSSNLMRQLPKQLRGAIPVGPSSRSLSCLEPGSGSHNPRQASSAAFPALNGSREA